MTKQTKLMIATAAMTGLLAGAAGRAVASTSAPTCSTGTAHLVSNKALANAGQHVATLLAEGDKHDCAGKNDCKGKGGCKTGDAGCKGKNSCKGKGGCKTEASLAGLAGQAGTLLAEGDKHDCAGKNDCKGKGGCKTGDAGCKGKNSCKGKGGCKTEASLAGLAGQAGTLLAEGDKHDCAGKNDCKGKGGCKTGDAGCKGKNSCKGKGGCKTEASLAGLAGKAGTLLAEGDKHDCAGKNDCKGKGGCKTGDAGCKGKNSCKGKGGCKSLSV